MRRKVGLFLGVDHKAGGIFQYSQALLDAVAALPKSHYEVVVCYTHKAWSGYLQGYDLTCTYVRHDLRSQTLCRISRAAKLPMSWWQAAFPYLNPMGKTILRQQRDLWIFPAGDHWSYQISVVALVSIHDLMHRYERRFPEVSTGGEFKRREKQYKRVCHWARGILVDSEVGKEQVMESYGVPPELVHVLPYVPPKHIDHSGSADGLDERYDLPKKFIFYPAHFWKHKNHKNLILAVASLRENIPNLKLILTGFPANGFKAVLKLVTDLGLDSNVRFLGFVPDHSINILYRKARALIMPTFFGPTNIPPLEAMVSGCPVAVSDIYAMREQLGDAAVYFNPSSVEDIAQAIKSLWNDDDLCKEMAQRGLALSSQWRQPQFSKRLELIIDKVLNQEHK